MDKNSIYEQRSKLIADAQALIPKSGNMTKDAADKFDRIMADVDTLGSDIERLRRIENLNTEQRNGSRPPRAQFAAATEDAEERRSFSEFIRTGKIEQRDLMVGNSGGAFVPQLFSSVLTSAQKAVGEIISAVNIQRTETGSPMKYAMEDDLANGFQVVGEGATVTTSDPALAAGTSNVDKIMTSTTVSFEELRDSYFNIDSFLQKKFFQRYARSVSQMIVGGSSTGNVQSIVASATSAGTAASKSALGYLDLLKMYASLDPDYRKKAAWLMNSSTLISLMGVLDTLGRPIFIPSTTEGAPDTLLGRPVLLGQQLDNIGPGKTPVLFGDYAEGYTLRQVGGIEIIRLNELYVQSGRVGFTAVAYVGGYATDAGTHPIQSLQMAAS